VFKLRKKYLFFSLMAIFVLASLVVFVSLGFSQNTNKMVLDISFSRDNYNASAKTFYDRSGLSNDGVSVNNVNFVRGRSDAGIIFQTEN